VRRRYSGDNLYRYQPSIIGTIFNLLWFVVIIPAGVLFVWADGALTLEQCLGITFACLVALMVFFALQVRSQNRAQREAEDRARRP
jgi:Ca2+/Na+ antiporter